jgi:hypothetical protein
MKVVSFGGEGKLTGEIVDGIQVRQSFWAEHCSLVSLSIPFATWCRKTNKGSMFVCIFDGYGKEVAKRTVNIAEIKDNAYHRVDFDIPLRRGNQYEIRIHTKMARSGGSVTAKWGAKKHKNTFLLYGAKSIAGEMCCRFEYSDGVESILPKQRKDTEVSGLSGMISVVIPHYNCVDHLDSCIDSLSGQTYNCMEVIIVDDGSDDKEGVVELLRDFPVPFPMFYMQHEKNKGAPAARNTGAKEARGEYMFFLDADCQLYPNAFETFLDSLLSNREAAYSYCSFWWGKERMQAKPFNDDELMKRNYISTMSMIRAKDFVGFDEDLKRLQDWDMWIRMAKQKRYGVWTEETLFESAVRENSITTSKDYSWDDAAKVLQKKHNL